MTGKGYGGIADRQEGLEGGIADREEGLRGRRGPEGPLPVRPPGRGRSGRWKLRGSIHARRGEEGRTGPSGGEGG